ncbi:hypothetical protein [Streptomyces sp. NPDC051219]|uniref:hypothetical protein n=1 Tax=Streptomyces sp. NPDC051219 TaxID=3155283 RepID=UPI00344314C1
MLFGRFRRSTAAPAPSQASPYRSCDELGAVAEPFSPLVGELLALYCHTRPLGALSQDEKCPQEYQLIARSVIHHIIEGWQNQTGGRGTIEDLLLEPKGAPVREGTAVSDSSC